MKTTHPHLLIIGLHFPEPKSSAAGSRMMQLISIFRAENWKITFASPAQKTPYSETLESQNITCIQILPNTNKADKILNKYQPDIVLFDRFMIEEQFGWRVSQTCPNALKILDTEDLHFLRKARETALKAKTSFKTEDLYNETAKRELASILRCDLTLIISEVEHQILTEQFHINPEILLYLPFLLQGVKQNWLSQLPNFKTRGDFMFIGNYWHAPNYDAVLWLKTKIWPLIHQQLPTTKLYIYGAYTAQKIQQLHNPKEGFIVKGRIENATDAFQKHRLLIAPLRFGAGLKGKLVEAMLNGTPTITTKMGVEGICGDYEFNGKIVETPTEIAQQAYNLYTDKKEWKNAQQNGLRIINQRFDKIKFAKSLIEKIDHVSAHLIQHRQRNFLGQVLQHHREQSTKYLSRWIETKNQS